MKRTLKKVLSLLLCAALVSGMMANSAFAAKTSGKCGKNAKWSYNAKTKTLTISGKGTANDFDYDFEAPDKKIKVVVKKGITRLSCDFCFYRIKSLKLPDTLKQLDGFCDCHLPSTITLPKSVTKIAPLFCVPTGGLKAIKVAKGNKKFTSKNGVLYSKDMKTLWAYPPDKKGSYVVPASVTRVEECRFDYTAVDKLYFKGKPPKGLLNMFFETTIPTYYNEKYEKEWKSAIKDLKKAYGSDFAGAHPWKG